LERNGKEFGKILQGFSLSPLLCLGERSESLQDGTEPKAKEFFLLR
jgi:hypothetical protein